MKKICFGMFFILFDFYITFETNKIGFIPDFLGFLLIFLGLKQLERESIFFTKAKPCAIILGIYASVLYFADLMGQIHLFGDFGIVITTIATILNIYMIYQIILGIQKIEKVKDVDLNSLDLMNKFKIIVILEVLTYCFLIGPMLELIVVIVYVVFCILFLFSFKTTSDLYEMNVIQLKK